MHLPDPMLPLPYQVVRVQKENRLTFTLHLTPLQEKKETKFTAGQFNMLYAFGMGEVAISISGDPTNPGDLIHTIREVGHVTAALHQLKRGAMLGVRGPFGSSWPMDKARGNDLLIIAGGIGLAPLRPVIYQILAEREHYGRVSLLYGSRTPEELLYEKELMQWRGRFDLSVEVTVDSAGRDWHSNVGVVTKLIAKAKFDPHHTIAMICGPEVMMRFSILELQKWGVKDEQIFISMERNMKCAIGFCGHCQYGATFICKDGPVFPYAAIKHLLSIREI